MTKLSDQTLTGQMPDDAIERVNQIADGFRALADFIAANPDLANEFGFTTKILVPDTYRPAVEHLAAFARAGAKAGAKVVKDYSKAFASVDVKFGPVVVHAFADRAEVCERVVVSTTEVTKEIPDPQALAAIAKVTVTETVEEVRWECRPLLAEAGNQS